MTEDDTFRILSRIPYDELEILYQEWGKHTTRRGLAEKNKFFEKHRWTLKEYRTERNKRYSRWSNIIYGNEEY